MDAEVALVVDHTTRAVVEVKVVAVIERVGDGKNVLAEAVVTLGLLTFDSLKVVSV